MVELQNYMQEQRQQTEQDDIDKKYAKQSSSYR